MFPDTRILEKLETQIAPLYEDRDPGHDYSHIRSLFRLVTQLIEDENIDPEFLTLLCLFHGLWDEIRRPRAEAVLRAYGYSDRQIEDLYLSIFAVADGRPNRVEESLVHDANRLERLGAYGIARTMRIAGFNGDDLDTAMMYLRSNLETTRRMFTRRGQKMLPNVAQSWSNTSRLWRAKLQKGDNTAEYRSKLCAAVQWSRVIGSVMGMLPRDGKEELETLQLLDAIVRQNSVRMTIDSIIPHIEHKLIQNAEALLVWEPVTLDIYGNSLPDLIRSSWVFILRAESNTGAERHPESQQRMMSYRGTGDLQTWNGAGWHSNPLVSDPDAPIKTRWVSIPPNTWHQAVVPEDNWVVVSFHTVSAANLIEERPDEDDTELSHRRLYLDERNGV